MATVIKEFDTPVPVKPQITGYTLDLTVDEAKALVSWLGKVSLNEKQAFQLSYIDAQITERLFFDMDKVVDRE